MSEQRPSKPPAPRRQVPPEPNDDGAGFEAGPPAKSKGALIGWIVSLLLVVGVAVALLFATGILKRGPGGGNPFGAGTEATLPPALDLVGASVDVSKITSAPPGGNDAAKTYHELVSATYPLTLSYKSGDVVDDRRLVSACDKIAGAMKNWDPNFDRIVDLLIKGADQGYNGTFDMTFSEIKVSFKNELAISELVYMWGKLLEYKMLLADVEGKYAEGEKCARAMLIFGDRLWQHSVSAGLRFTGLRMMNQSLAAFKAHFEKAGDAARAELAKALRVPVSEAKAKWDQKFQKLIIPLQAKSVGARDSALPNASDLWTVAENDKDPSWRITAIMWFGYVKGARGVNEGKVNEYLDSRARKEREKKGDLTLAAIADETKALPADAANDIVPVFGTNY